MSQYTTKRKLDDDFNSTKDVNIKKTRSETPLKRILEEENNPFKIEESFKLDANLIKFYKRRKIQNNISNCNNEKFFSINDVENIVKEREDKLIIEFNKILLDRLDEQYKSFHQYIEHSISSQMTNSKYDDYIN